MKSHVSTKAFFAFCLGAAACGFSVRAADGLVVHEWGTFASVNASDGTLLSGLEREEHRLPNFVRSHAGFSPADKGWDRPVKNVTIKMETPVLYFYSDHELAVTVDVGFIGGSISQWYPDRSGGEELPPLPANITDIMQLRTMPPVDFGKGFSGAIQWKATVLAPADPAKITTPKDWETPQWPRARVEAANRVRTPDGAVEGFLFYRGIGNFSLPLQVSFETDGRLRIENKGPEVIRRYWVFQHLPGGPLDPGTGDFFLGAGKLMPGQVVQCGVGAMASVQKPFDVARDEDMPQALVDAGLSKPEAQAMLATWKESYFDAPGLRVFWIVPRAFTDRILPLSITPAPEKLERVLVGRSEVLTPAFEKELVDGFRADGGARWVNDRYFLAYKERARQLGVVLKENSP